MCITVDILDMIKWNPFEWLYYEEHKGTPAGVSELNKYIRKQECTSVR